MRAEYDFSNAERGKYAAKLLTAYKCWLSCRRFTIQANTDEAGKIVWTAPIARRFLGQPLGNLVEFMRDIGNFGFMGHTALRRHFLRGIPTGYWPSSQEETLSELEEDDRALVAAGWKQDEWGRLSHE